MKGRFCAGFWSISFTLLMITSACSEEEGIKELPVLTTSAVTNLSESSAISGGIITFDGGSEITSRGVCWGTARNPTTDNDRTIDGAGSGSFSSTLINLEYNTTYYVKAYATNYYGTGYGNELTFTTPVNSSGFIFGTLTDIEGNTYKTIVIGAQTWMAENLRTTKLNDGTPIPVIADVNDWASSTTPALCWYTNDETTNKGTYGGLYNWHSVGTAKLAPENWHIPTREDWMTLIEYLGGAEKAGGKMKDIGFDHWESPNTGATNISGFSALAGGGRYGFCSGFHDILVKGYWWTATPSDTSEYAYYYYLDTNTESIDISDNLLKAKIFGFSVRCVRD